MLQTDRIDRQFLYVDMNSFFASCEQADNPAWQGKPLIVTPTPGSCALSASYEAKAFGIKTGTPEREARFLCPQVIAARARPKVYMNYHYKLSSILENLTPRVTMRSVDEGSLELFNNEDPLELAQQIKQAIWRQMSPVIHCSVGIGPNIFLSKLATDIKKPNGLTEIKLADIPAIYETIPLRMLCGISYGMERQLQRIGVNSVRQFYDADPEYLRQHLGVVGYRWWLQLHGHPSYEHETGRRTLSHSHVLPPEHRSPERAYVTLQRLAAKVGRRLRREGYLAGHISLYIRYADKTRAGGHFKITPVADTLSLCDHLQQLWRTIGPRPGMPVLQLAVWTHDLQIANGVPYPLFPAEQKRLRLAQALDRVNDRFGTDTVRFAITDTKGSKAPDRISFNALFPIEHE
jgi:DNA polymerase-4